MNARVRHQREKSEKKRKVEKNKIIKKNFALSIEMFDICPETKSKHMMF